MTADIQENKDALLLHEQVKLLYGGVPTSLLGNLVGSFIALLVYTGEVSPLRLLIWIALLVVVTVGHYLNYRHYNAVVPAVNAAGTWYQQFFLGIGLIALAVGSAGYFLIVLDNVSLQITLALMIVCIASFATTTLSPRAEIVIPFLIIIFVPVLVSLYLLDSVVTRYVFWMMLVLLVLLCMNAYRISRTITRIIELTIDAEKREEALRNSRQRIALYVQETPLAVIEWNLEFEVVAWNPAAARIFGYTESEVRGRRATELIFSEDQVPHAEEVWDNLIHNTGEFHVINENRRKNGSVLFSEWFNTPLTDNSGHVIGVISLVQDITSEMENEKMKREFVSIVSHELRTPVTSIKGSLALLASGALSGNEKTSKEMIDIALQNTDRLQLLLNDILDVEKLDSGRVEYHFGETDLVDLLENVVRSNRSYADKYGVTVQVEAGSLPCVVSVDRDRIVQVVTNILSNAIKFSEKEGTVTMSLERIGEGACRVKVNNRGDVIPESDREKLFSKFSQRDSADSRAKEGSGLGLYICQKILEKHDSTLDFTSTEEEGTTFFFDLKMSPGKVQSEHPEH